jgi:nucleoside-diphosphate-sugar epimerase
MSEFTILGGTGLIGKALIKRLDSQGHKLFVPDRKLDAHLISSTLNGHVIYCIGLTADFRSRPWDTAEAHIEILKTLLKNGNFTSLTYLSSTRVYSGSNSGKEDSYLMVRPQDADQIYNISKLMGESLCHAAHQISKPVRIVRISNVIGGELASENFIDTLFQEALSKKIIHLNSNPKNSKDYIALCDVTRMLEIITLSGRESCYNLASGLQISHELIAKVISKYTNSRIIYSKKEPITHFPKTNIDKLVNEFQFSPISPIEYLEKLLKNLLAQ